MVHPIKQGLKPNIDGIVNIYKASENKLLQNLIDEGDFPGALWRQGLFEKMAKDK